jgi:uncharacterized protein (DUF736 family)
MLTKRCPKKGEWLNHGSSTSTDEKLLNATNPEVIVISVGAGNQYGHPHHEIMERANEIGAKIYRTDESGNIIVTTDGKSYSINSKLYTDEKTHTQTIVRSTPASASTSSNSSNVVIKSISLTDEVVVIKNEGSTSVNMTGWKLVSVTGNQTFTFPAGYVLQPGATVKIISGRRAVGDGVSTLKWTGRYIWNNDGDPGVLYNAAGEKISEK